MNLIWWFCISRAVGRKDHQRVVELAEKALKKNPQDLAALSFGATHAYSLGNFTMAKNHAERALAINPAQSDLRMVLVHVLQHENDQDGMLEQAKWIIAIDDTNADSLDPNAIKSVQRLERILPLGDSFPKPTQAISKCK